MAQPGDRKAFGHVPASLAVLQEEPPADKNSIAYLFWDWRMLNIGYSCAADNEQVYQDIHKKQDRICAKMLLFRPQNAAELAMQL